MASRVARDGLDSTDINIHKGRFAALDLTDVFLDFTDGKAVIHWTLPTNLIVESNNLQIACVGKVQPSNAANLLA